ncbi:hypothetical protein C6B38_05970, partial [Spiroplasma sp. ChiS]
MLKRLKIFLRINYLKIVLKALLQIKVKNLVNENKLFKNCIKGIITDQGKEFSKWKEIEKITGSNVYFCDPGSPKQKPHVERINRDIRHWLPQGTDFNKVDNKQLNWIIKTVNNKLRPCL